MSLPMAPSAVSLVDSGEEISITSNFRESTTQLQYDILIDDILRMSKVHSGTTIRALRKVDNFSQFYTKPDSAMFEAVLKTKPLNKISNFKKPAERQRVRSKRGSQFYAAQVKHMHSLTPTNGTKFKIGTNSTTERGDTICFRHLTRWRLERAFLLTLVRTENGLRSGRPNPSSWHHGLSFVSSIVPRCVERVKRPCFTFLTFPYRSNG